MRTLITKVYKLDELEPLARKRALDNVEAQLAEIDLDLEQTQADFGASLKAIADATNVRMLDWALGVYGHTYIHVDASEATDLPEKGEACPFTGVFSDDVLTDSLRDSLSNGDTLWKAWDNLAQTIQDYMQQEDLYHGTEDYLVDFIDRADMEFLGNGDVFG